MTRQFTCRHVLVGENENRGGGNTGILGSALDYPFQTYRYYEYQTHANQELKVLSLATIYSLGRTVSTKVHFCIYGRCRIVFLSFFFTMVV